MSHTTDARYSIWDTQYYATYEVVDQQYLIYYRLRLVRHEHVIIRDPLVAIVYFTRHPLLWQCLTLTLCVQNMDIRMEVICMNTFNISEYREIQSSQL